MVRNDGTINVAGLLAVTYDTVEFRSALTPNITINTRDLLDESSPPNPALQWLRPTVVLRGGGQDTIIAPYGASNGGGWLPGLLGAGALVGLGFVLAKL